MSEPEGTVLGYRAWGRDGSEHLAPTAVEAARAAYSVKAPGRKRRAVLVMARTRGGKNFAGDPQEYSVPIAWWTP